MALVFWQIIWNYLFLAFKERGTVGMDYKDYAQRLSALYAEYKAFDQTKIPLCAAENYVSPFARQGLVSRYEGKYVSGYIQRDQEKDFIGSDYLEKVMFLASDLAKELFGAEYNDFRSLTGMNTVALILMTMAKDVPKILITAPQAGGHGSLPKLCNNLGVAYEAIPYDTVHMQIDYEGLNHILEKDQEIGYLFFCQSDLIQPPDLSRINLPDHVGIIYDATQTLGLIAGGVLPNPLSIHKNTIMIGGTHKTFPGVTCGYVATNHQEYIQRVNQDISPNFLRNVQVNNITSVCLTMLELLRFGKDYAQSIVRVANGLGEALAAAGISVKRISDTQFTQTHQLFLETAPEEVDDSYRRFREYGISLNKRKTPYISGFRLGVQEIARYRFDTHLPELAELLRLILQEPEKKEVILARKAKLALLKRDRYVMDDIFMEWD